MKKWVNISNKRQASKQKNTRYITLKGCTRYRPPSFKRQSSDVMQDCLLLTSFLSSFLKLILVVDFLWEHGNLFSPAKTVQNFLTNVVTHFQVILLRLMNMDKMKTNTIILQIKLFWENGWSLCDLCGRWWQKKMTCSNTGVVF